MLRRGLHWNGTRSVGGGGGSGGPGASVLPGDRSATTSRREWNDRDLVGWRLTGGRGRIQSPTSEETI
jgi:hypothetical protein